MPSKVAFSDASVQQNALVTAFLSDRKVPDDSSIPSRQTDLGPGLGLIVNTARRKRLER